MTLRIAVPILALWLAACASVPMADQSADATAKRFAAPPPGMAAIYLFRDEDFGGQWPFIVALNGKIAGQTAAKTYFLWSVKPGRHQVSSHAENMSLVTVEAVAGETYFIWQEIGYGFGQMRTFLNLVDETRGRAGVMASARAVDLVSP